MNALPMNGPPPWAAMSIERLDHVARVAQLVEGWAAAMGVDDSEKGRWLRAVWLHDALKDADRETLRRWSGDPEPSELSHGPAAANRAAHEGETDPEVLGAVRHHSIGSAEWGLVGRILYCADYLDPGRSFNRDHRAELARLLPTALDRVVYEVARQRLVQIIQAGWQIPEQCRRFWNSLVAKGDSP